MATRRPPTRARNNVVTLPSSSSNARPRSTLAKTNAGNRNELGYPIDDTKYTGSMSTSHASSPHNSTVKNFQQGVSLENGELNIDVVIRCRRRSDKEIQDTSPIVVACEGPKGHSVTIETAAPSSTLGVITLPPTRTYPFDMVFGPEADQSLIYQDVVQPMLEEILKGYNCTLFAYGQTGTGKTYTMQGDVTLTPLGNPSAQAGMIPRVLFKLFHQLESSGADYSVKVSYVELYNEELRDLLAPELSAPIGSTQPMGLGNSKETQTGLKIFDDTSKKGVFIQGLEETPVKDFSDALALLAKGSQRRQIAATKFNDHSSRSHSVFSITVHAKETSALGDDLLKVGKLNLVDLAGSENIGRSGAENKRAREAGMINQSLLTLGRVINALVDKSSHVPYRESKLTRLLQDSLGGRTKTCIIATISPARSNMEETLSTLDYAMRAKSIRNKPEVNQRMTRNALLKEYVAEIERLKSDVLAAREKNGIYFSEDTWEQLNAEHELRQTEVEEAKKQIEVIESQMRSVREEFEQSIALLVKTDEELKDTKTKLRTRDSELEQREHELESVKVALEEEMIVRQAHAASEDLLDDVATGLKHVVEESMHDVAGLFKKIEREMLEFDTRSKALAGEGRLLDAESRSFLADLSDFAKLVDNATRTTISVCESFQQKEIAVLSEQRQFLTEQVKKLDGEFKAIAIKDDVSDAILVHIQKSIKEVHARMTKDMSTWSMDMLKNVTSVCEDITETCATGFGGIEQAMVSMASVIDKLVKAAQESIESERIAAEQQRALVTRTAQEEIERLKKQNIHLFNLLESEKACSANARDELVKRVSSLLTDFSEERDRGLRNIVSKMRDDNTGASQSVGHFCQEHDTLMNEANDQRTTWMNSLRGMANEGNDAELSAAEGIRTVRGMVDKGLSDMRARTLESAKTHSEASQQVSKTLQTCSTEFEHERKAKRARTEAITLVESNIQSIAHNLSSTFDSTSQDIVDFGKQINYESSALRKRVTSYSSSAKQHIKSIQEHNNLLVSHGTRQSSPTGMTPRKRQWHYVNKWEKTRRRSDLLCDFRKDRRESPSGTSSSASQSTGVIDESGQEDAPEVKKEADPDRQFLCLGASEGFSPENYEKADPVRLKVETRDHKELRDIIPSRPLQEKSTNVLNIGTRIGRRKR